MSIEQTYFDGLYADSADPFGFVENWYEERKYQLTVASLPQKSYDRAFEPGCSLGILTKHVAPRCGELISWDTAAAAAEHAAAAVSQFPNVRVEPGSVPARWPAGSFDLIVLSELLYYFDRSELYNVIDQSVETLRANGTIVATHWRHERSDQLWIADDLHAILAEHEALACLASHREADFLIDVYVRTESAGDGPEVPSVAKNVGVI